MKTIKKDSTVEITFWDHCIQTGSNKGPVLCKAIGRVGLLDKLVVQLIVWEVVDEGPEGPNSEHIWVLLSTITNIKEFK